MAGETLRPQRRSLRFSRALSGQTGYRPAGGAPICRKNPQFHFYHLISTIFLALKKAQARRQTPKEDNRHAPRRQRTVRASPARRLGRLRVQSSPQVRFSMSDTTSKQSRRRRVRPSLNIIGELVAFAGWPRLAANRTPWLDHADEQPQLETRKSHPFC